MGIGPSVCIGIVAALMLSRYRIGLVSRCLDNSLTGANFSLLILASGLIVFPNLSALRFARLELAFEQDDSSEVLESTCCRASRACASAASSLARAVSALDSANSAWSRRCSTDDVSEDEDGAYFFDFLTLIVLPGLLSTRSRWY